MSAYGRPKVLIYRPIDESCTSHRKLEAAGCDVVAAELDLDRERFLAAAPDAAALMGSTYRGGVIDRAALESFPSLRLVAKYTIGVDDVDVEAASALGILVTHCPTEANWGGVAEGTVALMLTWLKRIGPRDRHVKAGGWRDKRLEGVYVGRRADGYPGLTIGIIGLGRIGSRLARLLAPWGVRLVAADPYVDDERFAELGVERLPFESLLREADVVTLHCSLTPETRSMIDAEALRAMKRSALLINTARGPMVDLDALCDALEQDRLAGAALDVFPEEPPKPAARILALGDKVLLSPHMIAANQGGTLKSAIPWATAAVLRALRSEVPEYVYNPEAIERWRDRFGGRPLLMER